MSKLGFAAFAMVVVACIARSNNPPQYGSPSDLPPKPETAPTGEGDSAIDPNTGLAPNGVVSDGGRGVCSTGTCNMSCPGGGCAFVCKEGTTCNLSCAGGRCMATCTGTAQCNSSCAGGDCTIHCQDNTVCNSTCDGGTCSKDYTDQAKGAWSCNGGGCM